MVSCFYNYYFSFYSIAAQEADMARKTSISSLLSATQRADIKRIAQNENELHSRRANTLLLIDSGSTHREASTKAGLTLGQVRYIINRFRKLGLAAFPPPPMEEITASKQKPKPKEDKSVTKDVKKDKKKKDKKSKKEKAKKKDADSKKKKGKKKKGKKKNK